MARFDVLAIAASVVCLAATAPAPAAESAAKNGPARVEATGIPKIMKVTLTERAAERLGVLIDEVRSDPTGRLIVPYASVLYDLSGKTWVYIAAAPLSFVRGEVVIDTIKGENVYLRSGPVVGTKVLSSGVPQVFGTEVGVGH